MGEYNKIEKRRDKNEHTMDDIDNEDFLRRVEADREMRGNINIYKSKIISKKGVCMKPIVAIDNIEEDEDDQKVTLDELLDGLDLETSPEINESFVEGAKASKDGISYMSRQDAREVRGKNIPISVGNTF